MLPRPPRNLADRALPIDTLPAGTHVFRIHSVGRRAVWFGPGAGSPPTYRFDDPLGAYGVCYVGNSPMAAFVETMLRDLPTRVLSEANLPNRLMSRLELLSDLRVVRAHSEGLVQLGTTGAIASAKLDFPGATPAQSYEHAMAWSRALHDHPDSPAGIAYHSSHDDSLACFALFGDRAGEALIEAEDRAIPLHTMQTLLARAVQRYGIILLPALPV